MFFVLLPTFECNLQCTYCFEQREPGRWDARQTAHVLRNVFDVCTTASLPAVRLHWQGGEVLLLGQSYWEETLGLADELARAHGVALYSAMQTNLMDYAPWVAPLAKRFLNGRIGTSFEPFGERRLAGGDAGIFRRRWVEAFDAARADGLEVGVLSLLTERVLALDPATYIEYLNEEFRIDKLRFVLPFAHGATGRGFWIDPMAAGQFLSISYLHWKTRGGASFMELEPFTFFESAFVPLEAPEKRICMYTANCAADATSILPDGSVVLCDSFAHSDAFAPMGNVFAQPLGGIMEGPGRQAMMAAVAGLYNARCGACRYLSICHGGCLVRSIVDSDGDRRYHYCDTIRMLLGTIETRMREKA